MSLDVEIEKNLGGFRLSVCFQAEDEVVGILGASGCGKSMTLKCIAGIERPDRGRIVLNGATLFDSERRIDLPPQRRRTGFLFQNYALFPNMTVEKNLMTGLRAWERDQDRARAAVARMTERFYLTGLEHKRPGQLSGGQQQRAALARILLTRPRLLMLDEPFSALDGHLRWKLELELMDLLKEFGGTTLFVSHSRDEIYRICSSVCVMDQGKSAPVVPVKTLFGQPETMAACMLSGCKNYSAAEPESETAVYAGDWGVTLECGRPVPENVACIGVRSHYIHVMREETPSEAHNVIECRIERIVEDVFDMIVMVSSLKSRVPAVSAQLRLELPKEQWAAYAAGGSAGVGDVIRVRIDPHDILLLRG